MRFSYIATDTALVTCVVTDYSYKHIHFLDGSYGGYAIAAKQMKAMA